VKRSDSESRHHRQVEAIVDAGSVQTGMVNVYARGGQGGQHLFHVGNGLKELFNFVWKYNFPE